MGTDKRTKRLGLAVSPDWYELVEKAAEYYGLSMTDVIMHATEVFLEQEPLPPITFPRPTKRGRKKKE